MNMYQSEIIPTAVLSRELWNRLRGKTTCSASQIHAADKVILWCSPQLKRTALRSMFLQKVPEERPPACSASPLTDSTLQRSYTAGHADPVWHAWPFLGRTAGSPCSTHCLAEKATPCHAGSAITALLPRPPLTATSGAGKSYTQDSISDSHSISEAPITKQGRTIRIWQWYSIGIPPACP